MKFVLQRALGDCGIAALATLSEQSYEDVYVACSSVDRARRGRAGLTIPAVVRTAKRIGVTLKEKSGPIDLQQDEGILVVEWKTGKHKFMWHYVLLYSGVIVDPADGVILDVDEFLVRWPAEPKKLLVETK